MRAVIIIALASTLSAQQAITQKSAAPNSPNIAAAGDVKIVGKTEDAPKTVEKKPVFVPPEVRGTLKDLRQQVIAAVAVATAADRVAKAAADAAKVEDDKRDEIISHYFAAQKPYCQEAAAVDIKHCNIDLEGDGLVTLIKPDQQEVNIRK